MADRLENRPPIQIKHVHSSLSYQQATYQKNDRHGQESPSGYGDLGQKGTDLCRSGFLINRILYVLLKKSCSAESERFLNKLI